MSDTKNISTALEQFLELLRLGLWAERDVQVGVFEQAIEWNEIFKFSRDHCVEALVWDGVMRLDSSLRPPRELTLQWYGIVVRIQQTNELINRSVIELMSLFEKENLNPVLLKGAGVAQLYPNPSHRGCGDIDIYVGEEGIDKACQIVETVLGLPITHDIDGVEDDCHKSFDYRGVHIELHHDIVSLFSEEKNRIIIHRIREWYPDKVHLCDIGGVKIATPSVDFNAEYIFMHMYKHFYSGGVGLRQVCDWAMQLHALKGNISSERVVHTVGWRVFGALIVDILGANVRDVPFYDSSYSQKAKRAMEIVLFDGNFGRISSSGRPQSKWLGRFHTLRTEFKRTTMLWAISPQDVREFLNYRSYAQIILRYAKQMFRR